ncbi:hypothetical protein AVEN_32866-1 [Araneus ventricosus]|uniref:Uncharacterized protein n=1 Tax=Araneus ventricosus TaxID=182803 RepID=A0A4Y2WWB4_ARAVE|nr:hypothetical protein AVEN_32866-1 [Araneus ventricosus]
MESHKKHDIKYFRCLRSNDGDGKMEFQRFSDSSEVIESTEPREPKSRTYRRERAYGEEEGMVLLARHAAPKRRAIRNMTLSTSVVFVAMMGWGGGIPKAFRLE